VTRRSRRKRIASRPRRPSGEELGMLMETTTGMLSVQEALQHDRLCLLAAAKRNNWRPFPSSPGRSSCLTLGMKCSMVFITCPRRAARRHHPGRVLVLARSRPSAVFRLVDQLDDWGTPAATSWMAISRSALCPSATRPSSAWPEPSWPAALGKEVIESVAFTGSGSLSARGSDVTAVFSVKQALLFNAAACPATLARTPKRTAG